uniref:E3 ubiquitin-protein ligase AMFR n=1 Tax=Aceria tosichella TaxID=561515 RepID=A0A6G1SFJ9_9ACAR
MEQIFGSETTSAFLRAVTSSFNPFSFSETSSISSPNIFSNLTQATTTTTTATDPTSMLMHSSYIDPTRTPAFNLLGQQVSSFVLEPGSATAEELLRSSTNGARGTDFDAFYADKGYFFMANTLCCCILVAFEAIQYLVLGPLRASEQQHLRETFWDYLIQKSLFVFCIIDTKSKEERSAWAVWFTMLGSTLLLSKLCKDRFEYLASSPTTKRWPLIKISILMAFLLLDSLICIIEIPYRDLSTHALLILLADASYVLTFVISVITRFIVLTYGLGPNSVLENSASVSYFSELVFSMMLVSIELFHHAHLLIGSHASIMIRGTCLMKIHTLLMEIRRRYRRHKHYMVVVQLMDSNFVNATKEDIEKFNDECAICWDSMDSARILPCGHLFHNSCLRSWLEQDTSCPTCRTSFKGQQLQQQDELSDSTDDSSSESEDEFNETVRPHQRNHLFHFDSSRYTNHPLLNWLPTISIEGFI